MTPKTETEKLIENMKIYRQGYDNGRLDGINSLQRIIEQICLDINEIKNLLKLK